MIIYYQIPWYLFIISVYYQIHWPLLTWIFYRFPLLLSVDTKKLRYINIQLHYILTTPIQNRKHHCPLTGKWCVNIVTLHIPACTEHWALLFFLCLSHLNPETLGLKWVLSNLDKNKFTEALKFCRATDSGVPAVSTVLRATTLCPLGQQRWHLVEESRILRDRRPLLVRPSTWPAVSAGGLHVMLRSRTRQSVSSGRSWLRLCLNRVVSSSLIFTCSQILCPICKTVA